MTEAGAAQPSREGFGIPADPGVLRHFLRLCLGPGKNDEALRECALRDPALCAALLEAACVAGHSVAPDAPVSATLERLSSQERIRCALRLASRTLATDPGTFEGPGLAERLAFCRRSAAAAGGLARVLGYPAAEEARVAALLAAAAEPGEELPSRAERWRIDSFLADALNLCRLPVEALREASLLVRITRLAVEMGSDPGFAGTPDDAAAAALCDLDRPALDQARKAARGLLASALAAEPQAGSETDRGLELRALAGLAFDLAEVEQWQGRLAAAPDLETRLALFRTACLERTAAVDAALLLLEQGENALRARPVTGQSPRLGELRLPLAGGSASLALGSVLEGSVRTGPGAGSVFDRQLLGLLGGQILACLPLRDGERPLGCVALGFSGADVEPDLSPLEGLASSLTAHLAERRTPPAPPEEPNIGRDRLAKLVHELGTPLAVIGNYASVLAKALEGTAHAGLPGAVERELQKVGEILGYYARGAASEPAAAPLQLPELFEAVGRAALSSHRGEKKPVLQTETDPALPPLPFPRLPLEQLLVNLVRNAAEALEGEGTIRLDGRLSARPGGSRRVEIQVSDDGPGLPDGVREQLFRPVRSSKGEGHAGLGLSIVGDLAVELGAEISCSTAEGQGTCFTLLLPELPAQSKGDLP